MIVTIVLTISILLNVALLWYIRGLIKDYFYVLEGLEDLFDDLSGFSAHLERVHSLETYYGDQTLQSLIGHSKELVDRVGEYEQRLSVNEINEDQDGKKKEE